jgi:TonB family protein
VPFIKITDLDSISERNIELAEKTGKVIRIGCMRENIIPVTFGISDPVILIPESLAHQPDKMNLAIRHELTHILNRDFATHLSVTCIQSLFWFHPLVHLIANQLVDYREMRCDSIIISDSTISKKRYASLLFELLPMPNLNRQISVNMAQQSSNLKQRIERITKQEEHQKQPYKSSLTLLATLLITLMISMACTDFQTQSVFDEEELDLMTDVDRSGERGYHQVIIFMSDEEQSERYDNSISQLNQMKPEYIKEVTILKGDAAVEAYGERGAKGVILIKTNQDPDSYNNTLQALGMEPDHSVLDMPDRPAHGEEDYFVVVEEMPELIGGLASIQQHIRYPQEAREAGIEGRVYIQFVVNEEGKVEDPRVIRGIGGGADEAALEAVKHAKFRPGYQRGQPVRVQYSLPIVFRLQSDQTDGSTSSADMNVPEGGMLVTGYMGSSNVSAIKPETLVDTSLERFKTSFY